MYYHLYTALYVTQTREDSTATVFWPNKHTGRERAHVLQSNNVYEWLRLALLGLFDTESRPVVICNLGHVHCSHFGTSCLVQCSAVVVAALSRAELPSTLDTSWKERKVVKVYQYLTKFVNNQFYKDTGTMYIVKSSTFPLTTTAGIRFYADVSDDTDPVCLDQNELSGQPYVGAITRHCR